MIHFTRQERAVLLFVAAMFIAGIGAGYLIKRLSPVLTHEENLSGHLAPKDKININTASIDELKELPGVGDVLAARINRFREEWGRFFSPEDIMKVKGITPKKYEKMKDIVVVE